MKLDFPEVFGVGEVQQYMGISKQYVKKLVEQGKITPVVHLSCGRIFLKEDIVAFDKTRKKRKIL